MIEVLCGTAAYLGGCLAVFAWQERLVPAVCRWWESRPGLLRHGAPRSLQPSAAGSATGLPAAPSSRGGVAPEAPPRPPAPAGTVEPPDSVLAGLHISVDVDLSPSPTSTGATS